MKRVLLLITVGFVMSAVVSSSAGHDPQLERAVQEALRLLKEKPVQRLTREPPPPTWGQRRTGS